MIKSLKRKLGQSEKELKEARDRIAYLESSLKLQQQRTCPCDDEFCISPTNQNRNSSLLIESRKTKKNACSLEILPTQDNRGHTGKRPTRGQISTGVRTLPPSYRVPRSTELPVLSLFPIKPRRSISESRQQKGSEQAIEATSAGRSKDMSDHIRTSSGYSSDTETMTVLRHTNRQLTDIRPWLESLSDQSENIPISTSNCESESSSCECSDDEEAFVSRESRGVISMTENMQKSPNTQRESLATINIQSSSDKRKSITLRMRETRV